MPSGLNTPPVSVGFAVAGIIGVISLVVSVGIFAKYARNDDLYEFLDKIALTNSITIIPSTVFKLNEYFIERKEDKARINELEKLLPSRQLIEQLGSEEISFS